MNFTDNIQTIILEKKASLNEPNDVLSFEQWYVMHYNNLIDKENVEFHRKNYNKFLELSGKSFNIYYKSKKLNP